MAGRVERRINDRFYFVLDEVGGSSDVESEAMTDVESKSSSKDIVIAVVDPEKNAEEDKETHVTSQENDINTENSDDTTITSDELKCSSADCQTNDETVKLCESESISRTESDAVKSLSSVTASGHDSEVVDMDIDCDSDDGNKSESIKERIEPILKITFRDEKIQNDFKSSLLKFLAQKLQPCTIVENNGFEVEVFEDRKERKVLDFDLDTTPNSELRNHKVPYYGKNFKILLSDNSFDSVDLKSEPASMMCFNCCGNHNLRDCPNERDPKVISLNRSKFQASNRHPKNSRYHLDENQRFGNFIPGKLSKNLRNALDLRKDQQPLFIYRMRLLGYPPAWLEEAKVSHSGVAVYDSKGVPILEEDEEEGEIIAEGAKDRFDISKIIEFPGFNVPLPKHMKEEGKLYSCPGISEWQSKENLIRTLQPNAVQAYKKKALTLQSSSIEEANETNEERVSLKRLPSPTIEEMEETKRQLLVALDDEDVADNNVVEEDDNSESQNIEYASCETPDKDLRNVKNLDLGTPVFKSISPFSKLPSRERFSVNISDVINYQNLPNSTGTYEKMSNLILKIRDTVSKIKND